MASSARGPVGQPIGAITDGARSAFLAYLQAGVRRAAAMRGDFILDLTAVHHIATSGLLVMTMARKEATQLGVKIILACPSATVREVLEISRYQLIFDIVDDLELDG